MPQLQAKTLISFTKLHPTTTTLNSAALRQLLKILKVKMCPQIIHVISGQRTEIWSLLQTKEIFYFAIIMESTKNILFHLLKANKFEVLQHLDEVLLLAEQKVKSGFTKQSSSRDNAPCGCLRRTIRSKLQMIIQVQTLMRREMLKLQH